MARIQVDDKLKIAFNFNNSDLQDNRQGFMSFRQKRKLRFLSFLKFDWIFAAIVGMIAVFIPVAVIAIYGLEPIVPPVPILLGIILIMPALFTMLGYVAFLCFIFYMWNTKHWAKFNDDIRAGKVNIIQIQIDSRRRSGFWFLGGEACIKISPRQLFGLHDNYTYRLYYAPNTCEILSVEIVRVDRGPKDKI